MKKKSKILLPNLGLFCYVQQFRPAFRYIFIQEGFAYASDGMVICKYPISQFDIDIESKNNLEGKVIHFKVWEKLCKGIYVKFHEDKIEHQGKDIKSFYEYSKENFPETFKSIFESAKETGVSEIHSVAVNPNLLYRISTAVNDFRLIVTFTTPRTSFVIRLMNCKEAVFLCMPLHFGDIEDYKSIENIA